MTARGDAKTDDRLSVLIVDDEPAIADGHAARLSDQYETATAYDGDSALELADDDVDVVVLDRRMPGLDGEEVLEELRDQNFGGRVMMLTGIEPDAESVDMAFDDYLVKPVGADDLGEAIDGLLEEDDDAENESVAVLDTLGDPKTRRCCRALLEEPHSASDLADETGYSLTTVYRRLNTLQQAGLIESRTEIEPGGDHYQAYEAIPTRIRVEIDESLVVDRETLDKRAA